MFSKFHCFFFDPSVYLKVYLNFLIRRIYYLFFVILFQFNCIVASEYWLYIIGLLRFSLLPNVQLIFIVNTYSIYLSSLWSVFKAMFLVIYKFKVDVFSQIVDLVDVFPRLFPKLFLLLLYIDYLYC